MSRNKTRKGFDDALTFISIFGFLVIALNSFTSFDLSPWTASVLMLVAGIALMIEGRVFTIREWGRDGIQPPEVPFIFTIIFGMFTIIVGFLVMPIIGMTGPQISTIVGMVAIMSIAFISLQKWVFN